MVYFLKPTYSLKYSGGFDDLMSGNNLYIMLGVALACLLVVVLVVQFKRPVSMGLCKKDDLDKDGKPKVNWMKTSLLAVVAALLGALAAAGVLMMMKPKGSSSPSVEMA